jgi:hypothetical protein
MEELSFSYSASLALFVSRWFHPDAQTAASSCHGGSNSNTSYNQQ